MKESNNWNTFTVKNQSNTNFQKKFEDAYGLGTRNNKNDFHVPNKVEISNEIYERRQAAASRSNSDNKSPQNNSNNQISENDVDMDFILNLTNQTNNENSVVYNFNKNFNEERKINQYDNEVAMYNQNNCFRHSSLNPKTKNHFNQGKLMNSGYNQESKIQDGPKTAKGQLAEPIHKKPSKSI